jgi:hypothetical protein
MMRSARQVVPRALLLHQLWPLGGLRLSSSSSTPAPPITFAALGIHPSLVERLPPGVRTPTPDQAEAARVLLRGNGDGGDGGAGDGGVVALAGATGTGKTLAYLLPLLTRRLRGAEGGGAVLVVSPSQELAAQVARVGKGLLLLRGGGGGPDPTTPTTTTGSVQLLIGGASIARQRAALAELGVDRRGSCTPDETEAERAARLRRQQAGRRLARARRRGDKAPAAPLALVAGTPARLARLLQEGSLDGRVFGSIVLEEADQLSAGSSGHGGKQDGAGGRQDKVADNNPFSEKKGYADALGVICAAVPEEARARAVLVSATLRRRPGALAALLPMLQRGDAAQAPPPPVFVPSDSSSTPPGPSPTQQIQSQPMKPKHVLVLAPPQHRAAAARAALRALGARAALVFAAERGGRLDDAAAKLKGLVGGDRGGGVWVLHGGMTPSGRKAALGAFARAVAAGTASAGVEKRRGPGRPRKKEEDDDDAHYGGTPLALFADDAREEEDASSSNSPAPSSRPPAVLVASDLAARGLDLPGLDAVVSLDPPRTAAAYAHRAGRVGRLTNNGTTAAAGRPASSFVVTVATAGAQAAAVRRLCASLGVALVEAPERG